MVDASDRSPTDDPTAGPDGSGRSGRGPHAGTGGHDQVITVKETAKSLSPEIALNPSSATDVALSAYFVGLPFSSGMCRIVTVIFPVPSAKTVIVFSSPTGSPLSSVSASVPR